MRVNTALANPDRDGKKGPRFDPAVPGSSPLTPHPESDRTSSRNVPFYSNAPDARPLVKISCPACAAKYSIADEKVSDRLAKIRCRKCNATIVIDGKANPPSVYTAAGEATTEASDDSGDSQAKGLEFTVDFGEGDQRTMTVPEIAQAYGAGQITQDTYLWAEGFADWKPLSEVEEVVSALGVPAPAAAPTAAPWASAAASPARAAARTAARAPAPDLFGGIDAAGSEDDVATSAPDHSSSASRGGGLGSSSAAGGSGTGARNESSVLFSLSALTSAASRPSSRPIAPAPSGAATREDSGLIDLKALTAAATKSSEAAAPAIPAAPLISPLAASPLGIAAPLGTPGGLGSPAMDLSSSSGKSKNGLYIGGGIAVAAIAAVAIAFILRPAPAPAPTPVAPPPVAAAPPPAAASVAAAERAPAVA
ncbi:MAG: DUF4339 domain-containing protein, partial [Myxococcales bacterium]